METHRGYQEEGPPGATVPGEWRTAHETRVAPPVVQPYVERTYLTAQDKLFGSQTLDARRAKLIRETYLLLSVAVASAMLGGWIAGGRGDASWPIVEFFWSGLGLMVTMFCLWFIPMIAFNVARNNPRLGVPALAFDGFMSGMILGPLVFVGLLYSGGDNASGTNLVHAALIITAAVFGAVTFYIHSSGQYFQAPRGLLFGTFVALTVGAMMSWFHILTGVFTTILAIGIGIFGTVTLIYSTSEILNDPDYDTPAYGALCLFASLFNIFQSVLYLLLGSSRD
ncbi:MAG: US12 family protein [Armatimonadetes bacterium]|nr:US12 family protein [Armatimonadota bacterium]